MVSSYPHALFVSTATWPRFFQIPSRLWLLLQPRLEMVIRVWVFDTRWVSDLTGMGMGTIFYPWVTSVPDPNRDSYRTDIFFHPQVTRRVPDTLLPL
jgi:hypothetical protein